MKIRYVDSGGTPLMVVEAENEQDRQIISLFVHFGERNKDYKFHQHSYCYELDKGIKSFNFGYIKKSYPKWKFWK